MNIGEIMCWRADLDFILSPRGFLGIIEGKYKTSKKKKVPRGLDYAQRPYNEEDLNLTDINDL